MGPIPSDLLGSGRPGGAVLWIVAIMAFLIALASASALALGGAARDTASAVAARATVRIADADPGRRDALAGRVTSALRATPGVIAATSVSPDALAREMTSWLGADAAQLPLPALVDVRLTNPDVPLERALQPFGQQVAVERQAAALGPLADLLRTLGWLAVTILVLMTLVAVAAVTLAARAAYDASADTLDLLHVMGATDRQLVDAFQRRVALDALAGGLAGAVAGLAVALFIAGRLDALAAGFAAGDQLGLLEWAIVAVAPLLGAALAVLAARRTIVRLLVRAA